MTIEKLNVGAAPNDGSGQSLRSGGQVINDNFAELDTRTTAAQAKADQGVSDAVIAKATADAAQAKADAAVPGSALGVSVAQLVNGTVPAGQLPSFVGDLLEYPTLADFPAAGEAGKIYIAINGGDSPTNPTRQYRWSGSAFVLIPASPGSSDQVPEGTTNLYFTAARVRALLLTGLGGAVNAAIVAGDSILQAFAKLQGQINAKLGMGDTAVDSARLNGQPASFYTATMIGATASAPGTKGLAPEPPILGVNRRFLADDGVWRSTLSGGEFTPKLSLVTSGGVVTDVPSSLITTAFGTYSKVGNRIFCELVIRLGATKPTGNTTDTLRVYDLPFITSSYPAAPGNDLLFPGAFQLNNGASTAVAFTTCSMWQGTSLVVLQKYSMGAVSNLTLADINANAVIRVAINYIG